MEIVSPAGHRGVRLDHVRRDSEEQLSRSNDFLAMMSKRRSVRAFSSDSVLREVVENCISTALTAPSGANKQPWRFVLIGEKRLKREIRAAAEAEERINYEGGRMPPHWREDLVPLGTDWRKDFLETAPWLIVVFAIHSKRHYYVSESVGIAVGFLIAALHNAGLVTLPHTPSPMGFLRELLQRQPHEKPFVLLPVGYPPEGAEVPDIRRKAIEEVVQIIE